MKNKTLFFTTLALVFLLAAASTTAWASSKDSLVVSAGTSSPIGIVPFFHGAPPENFYVYTCVASGTSLSDTIPVTFTLSGTAIGGSASISSAAHGNPSLAGAISVASNPVSVAEGGSNSVTITIGPVSLADGNYAANVQFSVDSPNKNKVQIDHDTVHIQVRVGVNGCGGVPSCFITDSTFNPLLDCSGSPVALLSSAGGTFQIVYNNFKKITATNPGQFYYNLIWTNDTGVPHDLTLTMAKSDPTLNTTGTNALHALVFASADIDPTTPLVTQFNLVNTNGTPCATGTTGPTTCKTTVTIQPGETVWVTWHLAYAKIGQNATAAGYPNNNSCPGTELISATGTISDTESAEVLATCTATATGYLKFSK